MDYDSNSSGPKSGSVLPPLSANYPWLVSQNMEQTEDDDIQSFYIVNDKLLSFQCRIPELLGRRIRGCDHGWLILSQNNVMWSLWNPVTSNLIRLPPLNLKDGDYYDIGYACLSSPPHDPNSLLLLFRSNKPHIVFSRLDLKRKKSTWIEMSYARQLNRLVDCDNNILYCPTCCNGKVYTLTSDTNFVIPLDILVKDNRQVVITLLPFLHLPSPFFASFPDSIWLKGYGTDLFFIILGFDALAKNTLASVYLYKLDMRTSATSTWEEIHDIRDTVFFMDLNHDDYSVSYNPAVSSEFGGYLHIRGYYGKKIYSYHVKDKTVSLSFMPLNHRSYVSLWECRLEGDTREAKTTIDYIQQEEDNGDDIVIRSVMDADDEVEFNNTTNESHLLNIPFHMLEMLMKFSLGIEYMNFRATCKHCHLAAPVIQWRSEASLTKLQTYSLHSPWLMVLEQNRGIMKFTDPISGDKYFMKTFPLSVHDDKVICCSRYGWLLFYYTNFRHLVFVNPFTSNVRKLPTMPHFLENLCFSAPPTSPNCTVVGFTSSHGGHAYILRFVDRDPIWHRLVLDYGEIAPNAFRFPTFYGRDLYALCNEGGLVVFREISVETSSWEVVVAETPRCPWRSPAQYFLVQRDQHHLLVIVGEFGDSLEVFELNDSTKQWEKIDSLGKNMIYISGATCFCIEAKTTKMQNKIYFPRLNSENEKIVFYSLETCRYHTFNGENIEGAGSLFIKTKYHLYPHAWIEPSW